MSTATHTPGPWRVDTEAMITRCGGPRILNTSTADSRRVAIADLWDVDGFAGDTLANARLIAAAPDLLTALRELLHHNAGEITCECCQAETHDCVFCQARAALAAAEGREP